ncbi:hypothetical protein D3C81_1060680 [compost metagenome]
MGVGEQGRAHVVPVRLQVQQLAALDQGCAFVFGQLQILKVLFQLPGFSHRADLHPLSERMTNLQLTHACHQRLDEAVMDAVADDQSRRGRTLLPGTEEGAVQRAFHGDFEVGVIEHHQGVLAAHFQLATHQIAGGGDRDAATGLQGTGEGQRIDVGGLDQAFADHSAAAHDQVEGAGGQGLAADDFSQGPGAGRHQVGRFEHHGVAEGQGRGNLPRGGGHGEIPRRDDADHADRFTLNFDLDAGAYRGGRLAHLTQHFGRVVVEELRGAIDLADALGQRLAFFPGEQFAEFFLARHQLVADGHQYLLALFQATGGPLRLGFAGGGDGTQCLFCAGLMVMANEVLNIRRAVVGDDALAFAPVAADVVFVGLQCHGNLRLRWPHLESITLQIKINNKYETIRKTYRASRAEDYPTALFRPGCPAEKLPRRSKTGLSHATGAVPGCARVGAEARPAIIRKGRQNRTDAIWRALFAAVPGFAGASRPHRPRSQFAGAA